MTTAEEEFSNQLVLNKNGGGKGIFPVKPEVFNLMCSEILKSAYYYVDFYVPHSNICGYLKEPMLRALSKGIKIRVLVDKEPCSNAARKTFEELRAAGNFDIKTIETPKNANHFVSADDNGLFWTELADTAGHGFLAVLYKQMVQAVALKECCGQRFHLMWELAIMQSVLTAKEKSNAPGEE